MTHMVNWPDEPLPQHARETIAAWAKRLSAAADLNAMRVNPVPGRREIEPWLAAWLRRPQGQPEDHSQAPIALPTTEPRQPDVRLWRALVLNDSVLTELFESGAENVPLPILSPVTAPPSTSIEVWTETELCALHAIWRLAHVHNRSDWRRRCLNAALWHSENLQPDNATNVPWAAHVFVMASVLLRPNDEPRAGALSLHAETLLHNAVVMVTRPDSLSQHVLADAAAALRSELQDPPPQRGGGNA